MSLRPSASTVLNPVPLMGVRKSTIIKTTVDVHWLVDVHIIGNSGPCILIFSCRIITQDVDGTMLSQTCPPLALLSRDSHDHQVGFFVGPKLTSEVLPSPAVHCQFPFRIFPPYRPSATNHLLQPLVFPCLPRSSPLLWRCLQPSEPVSSASFRCFRVRFCHLQYSNCLSLSLCFTQCVSGRPSHSLR
jgi:hypothetical protein